MSPPSVNLSTVAISHKMASPAIIVQSMSLFIPYASLIQIGVSSGKQSNLVGKMTLTVSTPHVKSIVTGRTELR